MSEKRQKRFGEYELSERQIRFVEAYLDTPGLVLTKACKKAGISTETGRSYLKDPDVLALIEKKMEQRIDAAGINTKWVLQEQLDTYHKAKAEFDKTKKAAFLTVMNRALEVMLRHCQWIGEQLPNDAAKAIEFEPIDFPAKASKN